MTQNFTVTVNDTDDLNSPVSATFTVTVKSAADLYQTVQGVAPGISLAQSGPALLASGNIVDSCNTLAAFTHEVQIGKSLPDNC